MTEIAELVIGGFAGFVTAAWLLYWLVYKPVREQYHAGAGLGAKEAGD